MPTKSRASGAPAPARSRALRTATEDEHAGLHAWVVLARAYHTILRAISRDATRYGITVGQFAVLEALYHKGPLALGQIGSLLVVTAGNVTYVVDQLERRGLVERERRPDDRRVIYASLTPKGRALVDEIFPQHARYVSSLVDTLEPAEREEMCRLLKKLGLSVAEMLKTGEL